jgi:hypothetical protein
MDPEDIDFENEFLNNDDQFDDHQPKIKDKLIRIWLKNDPNLPYKEVWKNEIAALNTAKDLFEGKDEHLTVNTHIPIEDIGCVRYYPAGVWFKAVVDYIKRKRSKKSK